MQEDPDTLVVWDLGCGQGGDPGGRSCEQRDRKMRVEHRQRRKAQPTPSKPFLASRNLWMHVGIVSVTFCGVSLWHTAMLLLQILYFLFSPLLFSPLLFSSPLLPLPLPSPSLHSIHLLSPKVPSPPLPFPPLPSSPLLSFLAHSSKSQTLLLAP